MPEDINAARSVDPGRGPFRAVTKHGTPLNFPPGARRKMGILHINKTLQDSQPVKERQRYKDWLRRQGK